MSLTYNKLVAANRETLKQVWSQLDEHSCPQHYNFHMHTIHSDGRMTPENLLDQAIAIGLKGIAITDHHSIEGYTKAKDSLVNKYPDSALLLWTGLEVTADLFGVEVHLLGYGFNLEHQAMKPYLTGDRPQKKEAKAVNVVDAIHQANGLVVLAHPARYNSPATEVIKNAVSVGIDGVEAYYAYGNPKPWTVTSEITKQVKYLAQEYSLFSTCGTDTHGLNLLYRI